MLPISTATIRLSRMGYVMRQKAQFSGRPHCHEEEYEFHYITEGNCRFVNGERDSHLKERSLVFSPPRMQHAARNARTSRHLSFFYLCFKTDPEMKPTMEKLEASFARIGVLNMGLEFGSQIEQLLIKEQSPNPMIRMSAQHLFLSLLCEIIRLAEEPSMVEADKYTSRLVRHMRTVIDRQLDLDSAAAKMGVSKAHLIRVFKRNMGMPPLRYFNRLKMDTARDLLRRSDMTLAQVADQLSFCDEFYFSRVFKKYTGVSPDGYRKGLRPGPLSANR